MRGNIPYYEKIRTRWAKVGKNGWSSNVSVGTTALQFVTKVHTLNGGCDIDNRKLWEIVQVN